METKGSLISKNEELKAELADEQRQHQRTINEGNILIGRLAESQQQLEELQDQLEDSQQAARTAYADADRYATRSGEALQSLSVSEAKLDTAVHHIAQLTSTVSNQQENYDRLASEVEESDDELKAAQADVVTQENLRVELESLRYEDREAIRSLTESNERLRVELCEAQENAKWWENLAVENGAKIAAVQEALGYDDEYKEEVIEKVGDNSDGFDEAVMDALGQAFPATKSEFMPANSVLIANPSTWRLIDDISS